MKQDSGKRDQQKHQNQLMGPTKAPGSSHKKPLKDTQGYSRSCLKQTRSLLGVLLF